MEHEFQIIMPELDVSGNKRLEKIKQKLIKKMSFNSSKDLTTLRAVSYTHLHFQSNISPTSQTNSRKITTKYPTLGFA